jgi:hypothetical protein
MPYQYVRETLKDGGKLTARLHDACQIALKKSCQLPANLTRSTPKFNKTLTNPSELVDILGCGGLSFGPVIVHPLCQTPNAWIRCRAFLEPPARRVGRADAG